MDFQLIKTELINLKNRVDELYRRLERKAVNEAGAGGGGTTSVVSPVTNTGTTTNPIIGLAVTPAAPGGAVALQGTTPGTVQTGNLNLTGKGKFDLVEAVTRFLLNAIPMLERGAGPFPSSPVDGQRYCYTTYRSWFTYFSALSTWRQEFPGTFTGSFPTVSTADNTAAPHIQVKRIDLNDRIYFWDGAAWSPIAGTVVPLPMACRVLDDLTSRGTFPYTVSNLQVSGVTDVRTGTFALPSNVKGVWYSFILLGTAGATIDVVVDNPDTPTGAVVLQGTIVAVTGTSTLYSGSGFTSLSSLGRMEYILRGSAAVTRHIIDIWAYVT